ncbi:hypothetical protein BHE74_00014993 [Ensete ventricosum]|nr:hypothetical protein GW17_00002266 [Ensete ventricosum]RWW76893.1 hypothetical protein BHE74_00014993 [Ensete ventricosum]RZR96288.1 hypothetical protein BHM03_00025282 [Ensete ventricosum]
MTDFLVSKLGHDGTGNVIEISLGGADGRRPAHDELRSDGVEAVSERAVQEPVGLHVFQVKRELQQVDVGREDGDVDRRRRHGALGSGMGEADQPKRDEEEKGEGEPRGGCRHDLGEVVVSQYLLSRRTAITETAGGKGRRKATARFQQASPPATPSSLGSRRREKDRPVAPVASGRKSQATLPRIETAVEVATRQEDAERPAGKRPARRRRQRPEPRLSNPPGHVHGELVAAGWPSWLSNVAGEAIKGWTPRRADTFEKIDKASFHL